MDVSIVDILKPTPGHEMWDIVVYVIFFIGLLGLVFLGDEASMMDTLFISAAVFVAVLDKVYAWGYILTPPGYEGVVAAGGTIPREVRVEYHVTHLGTFVMRVLMFALPLVVVGQTKSSRVRGIALLITIIGVVYTAARWFTEIRESQGNTGLGFIFSEPQIMFQGSLFLLIAGDLVCRRYWRRLRGVNWRNPLQIRRMLATDDAEIEVAQLADD